MTLLLLVLLAVASGYVLRRACAGRAGPRRAGSTARPRRAPARRRRLPPLPAADTPPAGLEPMVPSPRAVRVEAVRGIREIEEWLAGQASA